MALSTKRATGALHLCSHQSMIHLIPSVFTVLALLILS